MKVLILSIYWLILSLSCISCDFRLNRLTVTIGSPRLSIEKKGIDGVAPTHILNAYEVSGECTHTKSLTVAAGNLSQQTTCSEGRFATTFNFSSMPDGPIPVKVKGKGTSRTTSLETIIFKDTIAPSGSLSLTGFSAPQINLSQISLGIISSEDDYFYKVVPITSGVCSSVDFTNVPATTANPMLVNLIPNGTNTLCITSADKAHNWRTTPITSTSTYYDGSAPQLNFEMSYVDGPVGTSLDIDWTLTENYNALSQVMTLEYSPTGASPWTVLDSRTIATSGPILNEAFTYSWTMPSVATSNGRLRLKLEDIAGNLGVSEISVIIDDTPPVLNSAILADGSEYVGIPTITVEPLVGPNRSPIIEIQTSEVADFSDNPEWMRLNANRAFFKLSILEGLKTVYVRVRSRSGFVSNIVSAQVYLDSAPPPRVTVTSPLSNAPYAPGTPMNIAWTCSTTTGIGLADNPITSIRYSVDDGVSFHNIATNRTNNIDGTHGNYAWIVPATTPTGQIVSVQRPLRIVVNCSSKGGVVSSGMSELLNSQWKVLIGEPGNIDEGVHISAADLTTLGGFFGDTKNAIFYGRKHSIMRMSPASGVVTQWAGSMESPGCTLSNGGNGLLSFPEVIDINDENEILIYSAPCSSLYKMNLTTKQLIWSKVFSPAPEENVFYKQYVKSGHLVYSYNQVLYLLDLNNPSSTPQALIGTPGSCVSSGSIIIDSVAATSPLPCSSTGHHGPIVKPDLSKIWITGASFALRLEKDPGSGIYYIRNSSAAPGTVTTNISRCVQFDNELLYCMASTPNNTSRDIATFNTITETRSSPVSLPTANNISRAQTFVGVGKSSAYYYTNTNELFEVSYRNGSWGAISKIGGTAFHTYGNGSEANQVAFTPISSFAYDDIGKWLYIRGALHLRRIHIDDSSDPFIDNIETAFATQIGNTGPTFGMAVSGDLQRVVHTTNENMECSNTAAWNPLINYVSSCGLYYTQQGSTYPTLGATFSGANGQFGHPLRPNRFPLMTFAKNGNNNLYFYGASTADETQDLWIFESSMSSGRVIAGANGLAGYENTPDGSPALGARLSAIHGIQSNDDGDLLVFDGFLLRRITVTTDNANPLIYTELDFSSFINYPGDKLWNHAIHDTASGWSYFAKGADTGAMTSAEVWAAHPLHGFEEIPVNEIVLAELNRRSLQLAITPLGLLLLDSNKKRIIQTPLRP